MSVNCREIDKGEVDNNDKIIECLNLEHCHCERERNNDRWYIVGRVWYMDIASIKNMAAAKIKDALHIKKEFRPGKNAVRIGITSPS